MLVCFCVLFFLFIFFLILPCFYIIDQKKKNSCSEAYFLDLRQQIKRGDIHVPNTKKAIIGARIAQAELGDLNEPQGMLYSPYFPNWNSGIAHIIRKEHKKLKGKNLNMIILFNSFKMM